MTEGLLKPPPVPRCPKCGFASGSTDVCEACGATLPPVRPYLVSGPRKDTGPRLKREATGGWLAPILLIVSLVILVLGGLWYYFGPQIASARLQSAPIMAQEPAQAPAPAPEISIVDSQLEAEMPDTTTASEQEAASRPETAAAPVPTETPNPAALQAGAQALKSVLGGVFGDAQNEEASPQPSGKPARLSTKTVRTPAIEMAPTAVPRRKLPSAGARQSPAAAPSPRERPIVLSEEAFSTGREPAPPSRSGLNTRELASKSNFFVSPPANSTPSAVPAAPVTAVSNVTTLTDATFASFVNSGGSPVVVDFWAPWCGPCRRFAPVMEGVAADFGSAVRFAKVNVEESKEIEKRYQIRALPTLIVFKSGSPKQRIEGGMDAAGLKAWVNESR